MVRGAHRPALGLERLYSFRKKDDVTGKETEHLLQMFIWMHYLQPFSGKFTVLTRKIHCIARSGLGQVGSLESGLKKNFLALEAERIVGKVGVSAETV